MSICFSRVKSDAFELVCEFYEEVITDMQSRGLTQWDLNVYPTTQMLKADIKGRHLYRMDDGDQLIATFVLSAVDDAEYSQLAWHYGISPATLHRFAIAPSFYGTEVASRALTFIKQEALTLGYDSLRVDVCQEEEPMIQLYSSEMLREAGGITFDDSDVKYTCFETPLSSDCPMLPIRMYPAYRYGEMTPWGADTLRTIYQKPIPDDRTGEALEISAIKDLESVTSIGETLTSLVQKNRTGIMGAFASDEFPLLLKLLAAKGSLSVQVHPDDVYAREHEGKLGKTEAWVILHAEEGASILYGIKDGVTLEMLGKALHSGEDVEPMIQRVQVKAGDVFYMPSGMVHAIGGGILLYEIQQSSDVTYRLWDFNRTNDKGEKRPLHIQQSLDVIDPALRGSRAVMPKSGNNEVITLLDVPAFKLSCALVNGECALAPNPKGFRMLTALSSLLLSWEGDVMPLSAGTSVLLPASCPALTLTGVGRALISQ